MPDFKNKNIRQKKLPTTKHLTKYILLVITLNKHYKEFPVYRRNHITLNENNN